MDTSLVSELPLGHRLLRLLAGPFQWFIVSPFSLHFHFFFFFFSSFVLGACVYSEHGTAGEPGTVAGVGGCRRIERGLQGMRSLFSWVGVACASRHDGSLNGLCLASICGIG